MQTRIRVEVEVEIDHISRFTGSPSMGMLQDAISESARKELEKLGIKDCAMSVTMAMESRL